MMPFVVAAPTSSSDLSLGSGAQIPIEERVGREVSEGLGRTTAPPDVDIYNPAFDVTPAGLVTAIITENGVARPPDEVSRRARMRAGPPADYGPSPAEVAGPAAAGA